MAACPLVTEVVDRLERAGGTYPGNRRAHAKGSCFQGTFTPDGNAAKVTTAAHLQRDPVPVTVRFSNSETNPHSPDSPRGVRGLTTRFALPDGSGTDLVAATSPLFLAATPQGFLDLLEAMEPDPGTQAPDPVKMDAYVAAYPETLAGFIAFRNVPIPAGYGTVRYWAVHAFVWVDPDGRKQAVRYRWEPEAVFGELAEEERPVSRRII